MFYSTKLKKQLRKAFSLMEMMVVLLIMSMIMSSIIPLLDNKKIKMDAAIKQAKEVLVLLDAQSNYYIKQHLLGVPTYAPDLTTLVTNNYLNTNPKNIFTNTDLTFVIKSNGTLTTGIVVTTTVPTKYAGAVMKLLPNVSYSTSGTNTIINAFTPIPALDASHDNLMHRDYSVNQELRTSHGAMMIQDNFNSHNSNGSANKLVITEDNTKQPNNLITNTSNFIKTALSSLILGNLGDNKYGLYGFSSTKNNNLYIDAFNNNTGVITRGNTNIGEQSNGVNLSAYNSVTDNTETRISVTSGSTTIYGYNGNTQNEQVKIGNGYTSFKNGSDVLSKIDHTKGQFQGSNDVAIARGDHTLTDDPLALNNSTMAIAITNSKDLTGIKENKGYLLINDGQNQIAEITKDPAWSTIMTLGQILVTGKLQQNEILNLSNYKIGESCGRTGRGGKIKLVITGMDRFVYMDKTNPDLMYDSGGNLQMMFHDIKGVNAYISNTGKLICEMKRGATHITSETNSFIQCRIGFNIMCL